jgi:hypothetical protein
MSGVAMVQLVEALDITPAPVAEGEQAGLRLTRTRALVTTGTGTGGATAVEFVPPSTYDSLDDSGGSLVNEGTILAAAGNLISIDGVNMSDDPIFFQLFDAVAPPADTAVPLSPPIPIPPNTHFSLTFGGAQGRTFTTGISYASSSTALTKTLTLAPDVVFSAGFRP